MQPERIHYELTTIGEPRVSPDGARIVYSVTRPDRDENTYQSGLWMVDLPETDQVPIEGEASAYAVELDSTSRPLTAGEHRDTRPRWSPDGSRIAFVSHRRGEGKGCELYVIDVRGGEAQKILEHPEEIEDLDWSPDGRYIAFLARDRDEDVYGPDKDKDRPPRRIPHLVYRWDNIGWTIDRPRQLFVLEASGGEASRLTDGQPGVDGLSWSPDGRRIAFSSSRHPTWDIDRITDLFAIDVGGGEPELLTTTDASCGGPSWSPDGSAIAFRWAPPPLDTPRHPQVAVLDLDSREVRVLTKDLDRNCAPFMAAREPVWFNDRLLFLIEDAGDVHLYEVDGDGNGKPRPLIQDKGGQVTSFDEAAGIIAYCWATATSQPDLRISPPSAVILAHPEPLDTRGIEISPPVRFTATSTDGSEVEAWVIRPPNFQIGQRYPALLNIHGGPFTQYGNKLFDEFQVYANAGYVVVYSNPRGSSGYSEAWGRALRGPKAPDPGRGWGEADFEDLMAVMDTAVEQFPFIDSERLGVMGGSYGGYMTSWIISHDDRFKAAISERAVNNALTMCWTSDIGHFFHAYFGPTHLEDPDEYLRMSPVKYARNINTPLLILHSENDLRCPISQAEELFVALKLLGKDVEFVRFPGEGHELTRSGSPRHREQRFQVVLDYLGRKL